jgi:uncharacterized delta-60 repeat protein
MSHARSGRFRPRLYPLEERTAPAAGILDPSFGVSGQVTTRFPLRSDDNGQSIAIDGLGRIVVAGDTYNGLSSVFAVTRFTSAGILDTTFGGTGIVMFDFGVGFYAFAEDVAIDSLDRIVVLGFKQSPSDDFAVARLTAAGALDTSFDGDGKQTVDFSAFSDVGVDVAIDSLDRIVLAGSMANGSSFAVARLTVAGALDTNFDGDGKQTVSFGINGCTGLAVSLDSTDRILVAGSASNGSNQDFAVARLTTAGALDSSFDGDGKQTLAFGTGDERAFGVALDALGNILLSGSTFNGSNNDFAVARLTSAGALDNSFDADGKQTIVFGTANDYAYDVAVDSLNRVVVAGYADPNADFAVARLTVAGALDTSFDGDGRQTVSFTAGPDYGFDAAIDSLDRPVLAGRSGTNDFAVARLTATGTLDSSFDGDGRQTLELRAGSLADGLAVAVDSLGRTVVAGYVKFQSASYDFAVTRYTPAGSLDMTFGGTGRVTIVFGTSDDQAYAVAVDSLDRIVVAGYAKDANGWPDFAIARLTAAGTLDTSFDGDGKKTVAINPFDDIAYGVAIDSLDRIVVAGFVSTGSNSDFAVARLTPAGALDISFDGDGKQTVDFGPLTDYANSVAVDSLDRVVLAGYTNSSSNVDFALARLTGAGALDTSFDGDGKQTFAFGSSIEVAYSVAVDSLDRVIAAGYTFNGSNNDMAVARLTTAGTLDSGFDGDGKQTIAVGSSNDVACGVTVDSQDRVVVAGSSGPDEFRDFAVVRLTSTGAFDTSFDGDGKQTIDFGTGDDVAFGVAVARGDRVVLGGDSNYAGRVFVAARLTGETTVAVAQVNDDSRQRSQVTSLTVRFSGQVTFSGAPANAFTLMRTGGGAVAFSATVSVQFGGTVVVLTNFTGPETEFGSLRDGRYTLTALSSQISAGGQALDGDADGTPGGDFVFGDAQGLFRFFGDYNGDRHVDIADFGIFSSTFNLSTGQSGFLAAFDFNNDGHIDIADFGQFSLRLFTVLP